MTHLCVSCTWRRLGPVNKFKRPIFRDMRAKSLILKEALSNPVVISRLDFLKFSDTCAKTSRVTQLASIGTSSAISKRFRSKHSFQINSLVFVYVGVEAAQQTIGSQINDYQPLTPITMSHDSLTWNLPVFDSCGARDHRFRNLLLLLGACSSVGTSHLRVRGKDIGASIISLEAWVPMCNSSVFAICTFI